jgi:hypothetical protein
MMQRAFAAMSARTVVQRQCTAGPIDLGHDSGNTLDRIDQEIGADVACRLNAFSGLTDAFYNQRFPLRLLTTAAPASRPGIGITGIRMNWLRIPDPVVLTASGIRL